MNFLHNIYVLSLYISILYLSFIYYHLDRRIPCMSPFTTLLCMFDLACILTRGSYSFTSPSFLHARGLSTLATPHSSLVCILFYLSWVFYVSHILQDCTFMSAITSNLHHLTPSITKIKHETIQFLTNKLSISKFLYNFSDWFIFDHYHKYPKNKKKLYVFMKAHSPHKPPCNIQFLSITLGFDI